MPTLPFPLASRPHLRRLGALLEALLVLASLTFASAGCDSIPRGRAAIDSVNVVGNDAISSGEIEDRLATTASPKFLGLFQGVVVDYEIFDRYVLQRDLERVERFYRARGFYEARARAARVFYTEEAHVRVVIEVEEGKPITVGKVQLDGIEGLPPDVVKAARRATMSKLRPDKPFDEDKYADAEVALKRALTDHGYAWAKVERTADVDLVRHSATVVFKVTPDRPAKLGKITIEGLDGLPEGPVRRALDLKEGEAYSTATLDSAQQSVLDLGVFGAVDIVTPLPEPPPEDRVVPVTVKVTPTRLQTVRLGGGVELDVIKTDIHLLAGWEGHNVLGGMRRLAVTFKPALVLWPTRLPDFHAPTDYLPAEKFRVEFGQPGFIEARTNGIVRGEFNVYPVILTPDIDPTAPVVGYREAKAAAGVNRTFWKFFGETTYNFQIEFPFTYKGPLDPNLRDVTLSYIDLLTQLDLRDDRVHPHAGAFIGNDFQVAGGIFGGDAQDIKVQPEVRGYVPIARKVTFAARGSVGFLFPSNYGQFVSQGPPKTDAERAAWTQDVQVSYFRAFFSGGPSSNRGYPLRGVGPHGVVPFFTPNLATQQILNECSGANFDTARCAVPLGGFTLWEASAELRFTISGPLAGATFCDASDVSPQEVDIRLSHPHLSCGVGLRYDTPVGPIRLDAAYRIPGLQVIGGTTENEGDPGTIAGFPLAIAFGIGEAF